MLFIATNDNDFEEKLKIAKNLKIGIEILQFTSYENLYDNEKITAIKKKISGLPVVIHAPYKLFSVSDDKKIREIVTEHCQHTLNLAKRFDARRVVFHTGYIAASRSKRYIESFSKDAFDFFSNLKSDTEIVVENLRENPSLMKSLIPPEINMCLDVGHVNVYSDCSLGDWLRKIGEKITYVHLHNNFGEYDDHGIGGSMDLVGVSKLFNCDLSIEVFGDIHKIENLVRKILEEKLV